MKFFKFISENNESITDSYKKIKYEVGKEIVVNDVNMNKFEQCTTGIHCICMDVKSPINCDSILFGPKIAVLEAKEEDIIYFSENGKCRLKECKVIDIYNTKDLSEKFKYDMGRHFYEKIIFFLSKIEYDQRQLDLLCKSDFFTIKQYFDKLDKYYPEIEEYLIDKEFFNYAIYYAIKNKKYNNRIIIQNIYDVYSKCEWVKTFPEDKEEIEDSINKPYDIYNYCSVMGYKNEQAAKFTEKMSQTYHDGYLVSYVLSIGTNDKIEKELLYSNNFIIGFVDLLKYIVRYNRTTKDILDVLKEMVEKISNNGNYNMYKDFADKIIAGENIKDIALSSSEFTYIYTLLSGKITEEIKDKIKESQHYTFEYFLNCELDKDMYSVINETKYIAKFICNFGIVEEFLDAVLKQEVLVDNYEYNNFGMFVRSRSLYQEYQDKLDKILSKIERKSI